MKWIDCPSIVVGEVREPVEAGLLPTPVVGAEPVLDQFTQVGDRHPGLPTGPGDRFGKAGAGEALPEVLQVGIVHLDA